MIDTDLQEYEQKLHKHKHTYETLSGCFGCLVLIVIVAVVLFVGALLFRAGVRWSLS